MKNSEVEKILRFYKDINLDIRETEKLVKEQQDRYNSLGAVKYSGIPHGNSIADTTAELGEKLAELGTGEMIKEYEKRLDSLRRLQTEIAREISTLLPIHKSIIIGFYINAQKWERIAEQIKYSVRQSKNIRCVALESLGAKMTKNKYISQSKIILNDVIG